MYAKPLCLIVYALLAGLVFLLLRGNDTLRNLYLSVCIFLDAIIWSFLIFLPEFPHGNVFAVGIMTTFLSAFSIFVWSIGNRTAIETRVIESAGPVTVDYIKTLFSFVRQGAFAAVALFGALFFAAYSTGFKFVESITSDKSDTFLLNLNLNMQIAFYVIYLIVGAIRYFFLMNLRILSQFETVATRLDREEKTFNARDLPRRWRPQVRLPRVRPPIRLQEPGAGAGSEGE